MPRDHIREFYQKGGYIKPPSKTRTDEALKRVRFAGGGKTAEQAVKVLDRIKDYVDPAATKIADWAWRSLPDVAKLLPGGVPKEVPEHVLEYGDFIRRMRAKEEAEGLDPRDALKAYTTTLSSIQRQARNRDLFPEMKFSSDEQMIRPEGAFSDWLGTKAGQRYLNRGAKGDVDEAALQDMAKRLNSFGLMPSLQEYMRGAPELISSLAPTGWESMMHELPGIDAAKKGFMGSMIGHGDRPTFDARQIALHVPPHENPRIVQNMIRRGQGLGGEEAVARLAARQNAFNMFLPPEYRPDYQHLAHHTIWDAAAGEKTTHADIMDMMENRATGGRVGYAGGGKTAEQAANVLKRVANYAYDLMPEQNLIEQIAKETGHSVDKILDAVRSKAKGIRNDAETFTGWSGRKGSPEIYNQSTGLIVPEFYARNRVTPMDLYGPDNYGVFGMSDRTRGGARIKALDETPLEREMRALGGSDYPYTQDPGRIWASDQGALSGLTNAVLNPSKKARKNLRIEATPDSNVFYLNKLMGAQAGDQSYQSIDLATQMLERARMTDAQRLEFDAKLRPWNYGVAGETMNMYPDWIGSDKSAAEMAAYLKNRVMGERSPFMKFLDLKGVQQLGAPNPASIRLAITDPALFTVPEGTTGRTVSKIDLRNPFDKTQTHPDYPVNFRGEHMGTMDKPLPHWLATPDWWQTFRGGRGRAPTADDMTSFRTSPIVQRFDQQWLDRVMPEWEKLEGWTPSGLRRGGRVGYAGGGKTLEKIPKYIERVMASPLFQEWFGKSKLVDEAGRPTPVFHASPFSFDAFREPASHQELGIHVGDAPTAYERSKTMMPGGEPQTYPLFARAENPLRLPDLGTWYPQDVHNAVREHYEGVPEWHDRDAALRWLRGKGHDSVVYQNQAEVPGIEQVKSRWDLSRERRAEAHQKQIPRMADDPESEIWNRIVDERRAAEQAEADAYKAYERFRDESGTDSYMLFSPKQLKSALNPGSWSPWDPGLMKADGGPVPAITSSSIEGLVKLIKKASGIAQSRRFQDAADVTNLKPYSEQALLDTFSRPESVYGAMQPSHFERYAYPLKLENNLLQPREMPGATKPAYVAGSASPDMGFTTREEYLDHLRGIAEGTGFASVPELHVGYRGRGETPIITTHDGRHRMRTLRGMGDEPTLVEFKPELLHYKGVTVPRLPTMLKRGQILPQNNISRFDTVDLPDELFAFGGPV